MSPTRSKADLIFFENCVKLLHCDIPLYTQCGPSLNSGHLLFTTFAVVLRDLRNCVVLLLRTVGIRVKS